MATSIEEQIVADMAAAYLTRVGTAVPFYWGTKARIAMKALPCVCFVPVTRQLEPEHRGGNNPLPLYNAPYNFEIDCWAADTGAADTLWRRVIVVLRKELTGAFRPGNWLWQTEATEQASWLTHGAAIRQLATIMGCVTDDLLTEVELEAVSFTSEFVVDIDDP